MPPDKRFTGDDILDIDVTRQIALIRRERRKLALFERRQRKANRPASKARLQKVRPRQI